MSLIGDSKEEDREIFSAMRRIKKARRAKYGVACPECLVQLPRAQPKILLPGQTCRAHKGKPYRDPRPYLSQEQEDELWGAEGFVRVPHVD